MLSVLFLVAVIKFLGVFLMSSSSHCIDAIDIIFNAGDSFSSFFSWRIQYVYVIGLPGKKQQHLQDA